MEDNRDKVGREEFEALIRFTLTPSDFRRVMLAYRLSKYGHRNQTRETGERYFEHPKAVALILIQELNLQERADVIIMALMHDLQEDTFLLTWDDIELIFGEAIVRGVRTLTKEEGKAYHEHLLLAPAPVILVKLADRLHNLRTVGTCSEEKRRKQMIETREKYLPLAKNLRKLLPANEQWRSSYFFEKLKDICFEIEKGLLKAQV